eukprot:TRINITY_DN12802_c0_g1_i1.p1 TRINITY_DN12802_c0_g1~~TRINITY_DN12802_c0_g1_i1.p1  ORF type:complete len:525 (+),score=101.64 TRINITY_DN12802_c0_g1_i1:86-1660(+)
MSHCILEAISFNYNACSVYWIISFSLIILSAFSVLVLIIALMNLYRTPWSTSLTASLEETKVDFCLEDPKNPTTPRTQEDDETESDGLEIPPENSLDSEEKPEPKVNTSTTPNYPPPLHICERCGTSHQVQELSDSEGTLVICPGCLCYKMILRSLPAQAFFLPSAFMSWFFGLGEEIFLVQIACGMSLLMVLAVVLVIAIRNPEAIAFIFSRRPKPDNGGEGEWERLNRVLGEKATALLDTAYDKHRKPIREILIDEEDILWLERVSFSRYIKNNHDFQIWIWAFSGLPLMWGAIGLFFILSEIEYHHRWDLVFGIWITAFVVLLSGPVLISFLVKCRVTYVLTNFRALRVNSTLFWFSNRVYSYPYHRMFYLHTLKFPYSEEGKVYWQLPLEQDGFCSLEYVSNVNEAEQVLLQCKTPVVSESRENILKNHLEMSSTHLEQKTTFFKVAQFLPIVVAIALILVLGFIDFGWSVAAATPLLPSAWFTVLFHLIYRKFNFLKNCTSKFFTFDFDLSDASLDSQA